MVEVAASNCALPYGASLTPRPVRALTVEASRMTEVPVPLRAGIAVTWSPVLAVVEEEEPDVLPVVEPPQAAAVVATASPRAANATEERKVCRVIVMSSVRSAVTIGSLTATTPLGDIRRTAPLAADRSQRRPRTCPSSYRMLAPAGAAARPGSVAMLVSNRRSRSKPSLERDLTVPSGVAVSAATWAIVLSWKYSLVSTSCWTADRPLKASRTAATRIPAQAKSSGDGCSRWPSAATCLPFAARRLSLRRTASMALYLVT